MSIPDKLTIRLDPALREALGRYMGTTDLTSSGAVRVLLTQALRAVNATTVDQQNLMLTEARREVRAKAKEALARVLHELENG
jgi:hypothetical protein